VGFAACGGSSVAREGATGAGEFLRGAGFFGFGSGVGGSAGRGVAVETPGFFRTGGGWSHDASVGGGDDGSADSAGKIVSKSFTEPDH
jgi:hypothetical protein